MQEQINEIKSRLSMTEYKIELHESHIEKLATSIKNLTDTLEKKLIKDDKVLWIGKVFIAVMVMEQFGFLEVAGKIIGVR